MTFTNVGTWDRVIRILAGIVLGYLTWTTWPVSARTGFMSLVFLVLGAEVFVTGLAGWSPMYSLFGCSTTKKIGA